MTHIALKKDKFFPKFVEKRIAQMQPLDSI